MWHQFQLWRALSRLAAIRRTIETEEYDGKPTVWQALRLVDDLHHKISLMRREARP